VLLCFQVSEHAFDCLKCPIALRGVYKAVDHFCGFCGFWRIGRDWFYLLGSKPDRQTTGTDKVFLSMNGVKGPLGYSGVRLMLKKRADLADVTGRINPHSLRHAFAKGQSPGSFMACLKSKH
jgi:integrase